MTKPQIYMLLILVAAAILIVQTTKNLYRIGVWRRRRQAAEAADKFEALGFPVMAWFLRKYRKDKLEPEDVRLLEMLAGNPGMRAFATADLTPTELLKRLKRDGLYGRRERLK
jgi:hypothetical protein